MHFVNINNKLKKKQNILISFKAEVLCKLVKILVKKGAKIVALQIKNAEI